MKVTFKKILVAGIMATTSLFSFGANNGIGGYWVNNIVPNAQAVQGTLMQRVTGANYSCGPTALLFVSNHYRRIDTGQNSPNMSTVAASQNTLAGIYSYLRMAYNNQNGTSLDDMKSVAVGKFGWTNVARKSANNTVTQNMDSLINYLNQNVPVLAVLRGGYAGNPVKPYDHIVVITAYNRRTDEYGRAPLATNNTRNLDTIDWYEPYYGRQGTVLRKEVTSSGSTSAFNITNFSFLAVGR